MTDAYTQSAFAAPASPVVSEFDTSRLDTNLRALSEVERTSRLPALPDAVRLDLASMPGADETSLIDLLTGLDDDLNGGDDEPPSGLILPDHLRPNGMQQAQIILAGISNNPPPSVVSEDAISVFKRKAIAQGYLPEDTPIDSSWAPEFNRVQSEMSYDQYNRSLRQPAIGLGITDDRRVEGGLMGLLNDFTSPSGLLAAATELDLWFDGGAIRSEISSWGDKWREVGKSKNPWDFAGNLIDALTGPIDDIVFPILNIGLMFTGIGAVANGARVGWNSARLLEAGGLFGRLYGAGRFGANLDEIGRAGMLANRLMKSEHFAAIGRGMEAWRAFTPTRAVKSVVQQGMRLGFANELEDRFGSYKGDGASLSAIGPVDDARGFLERMSMAPVAMPLEVLFAPYNVFSPGSFRDVAHAFSSRTFRALGADLSKGTPGLADGLRSLAAPGRAAAGALAGAVGGAVLGDDAGDIGEGALLGAVGGAAVPLVGRGVAQAPVASALKGAVIGGVAGAWLGDDPKDMWLGALAGATVFTVTDTVRAKMFDQLGYHGVTSRLQGLGNGMQRMSFIPLSEKQELAVSFDRAMQYHFRDDVDSLAKWKSNVQNKGVRAAWVDEFGGTEELAAAAIVYMHTSAMTDFIAVAQADMLKGSGATRSQIRQRYHTARNKLINQTRNYDLTELTEGMMSDIALSLAFTREGADNLQAVYKRRDLILAEMKASPEKAMEWAGKQVDMATETLRQLFNPKNLPKLNPDAAFGEAISTEQRVASSLPEEFVGKDAEARGWIMQKYIDQTIDTFGNYPKFASATAQIREARFGNLFDGARLKAWKSAEGYEKSVYQSAGKTNQEKSAINSAMVDQLLKVDADKIGRVRGASPLAEPNNPAVVTVGRLGKRWKGDLLELADQIRDIRNTRNYLKRLTNRSEWSKQVTRLLDVDESTKLKDLTAKQIESLFKTHDMVEADQLSLFGDKVMTQQAREAGAFLSKELGSKAATQAILGYAKRNNLSLAELDEALEAATESLANNADLWKQYGFDELAYSDEGKGLFGWDALDARLKELKAEIPFRAAEIDTDDLIRYLRESGNEAGAQQMEILAKGAKEDGYTLVHGVEFLMPEDLIHGPIFEDVTRRHLNAASLGNAFRGKLPVERLLLEERRQRLALANALKVLRKDIGPEDPEISRILRGLNDHLHDLQQAPNQMLRNYHLQSAPDKFVTRLKSVTTPIRVDDLARRKKSLIPYLTDKLGLSAKEAEAVWQATHKFRSTDWSEVGAYALEAKLRSTNVVEWGLKTLTGAKYGAGLKGKVFGGVVPAAVAGGVYGAVQTVGQDDLSFEDRLKAVAAGAGMGVAGLAAARVGSNVLRADKLADRASHWRYGYLPDYLAQVRDSMRFTLSPMFDLSRYTEGLFLAQTAAPLRNADGSRMVLPLNLSPYGLKKALRNGPSSEMVEQWRKLGKTEEHLKRWGKPMTAAKAQEEYENLIDTFNHFAKTRGDFDAEVLDSTGRWFKQLGILGFSPVDWMGTAFAQMVRHGLSEEAAYQAAREMYTYGIRGRSAAEMTANFVFFPFSFQKKAIGHMAKWMNDDLSRSIIIHDALKTYELLDEKYNLDERWRDHLPVLQQLNRLNLFAFGLSPGRFGGINSQVFESLGKLGWNAFVPTGLDIKGVNAHDELFGTPEQRKNGRLGGVIGGMLPVWNDVNWMIKNYHEQKNVISSPEHATVSAEIRRGYEEWTTFKEGFEDELARRGYTINDLNLPWMSEMKAMYYTKKAEIGERFPQWENFREEAGGRRVTEETEKNNRIAHAQLAMAEHRPPKPDDFMLYQMEEYVNKAKEQLQFYLGTTDLADAPQTVRDELRRVAAEMIRQNPSFQRLYDQYYLYDLGPLTVQLSL